MTTTDDAIAAAIAEFRAALDGDGDLSRAAEALADVLAPARVPAEHRRIAAELLDGPRLAGGYLESAAALEAIARLLYAETEPQPGRREAGPATTGRVYVAEVTGATPAELEAAARAKAAEFFGHDRLLVETHWEAFGEPSASSIDVRELAGPADPAGLAESVIRYGRYQTRRSADGVKRDPEMTCTVCGRHLADVEPGDDLAVLLATALAHDAECEGAATS